jgi:hypothetical protein
MLMACSLVLLLVTSLPAAGFARTARGGSSPATSSCFGKLTVTPSTVRIGQKLALRGRGFTCKSPNGKLFPSAPVFFYRPGLGFRIVQVPVTKNGTYRKTITVPGKLINAAAVNGGPATKVVTRPGNYYFSISLFDVHLDPINRALAHVRIVA